MQCYTNLRFNVLAYRLFYKIIRSPFQLGAEIILIENSIFNFLIPFQQFSNLPYNNNEEVENIPEGAQIGAVMTHEPLSYYLYYALNPKYPNKK